MKKKTVKKMLSAALVGAMVLSLAACGSKGDSKDEGGDSKDGVTLEFQQWWGVELPDGALDDICKDFTKDTGINIKLLSNPYADTKTQIAAGAAAGTMADVVGLDGSWVYDFAKQGSIANLTELMEKDGYDDSQLSDQIKYEGNTYMIPVVNFAYPMYVNMDILKAAAESEGLNMIGKKKLWVKIVIIILLVIGALFAGFPILWMILNSFKPNSEIFAWPPTWISKTFSLDAYKAVLTDPEKVRFFVNSYVIALTVVVITLVIGILASYAFSRFNFRGKSTINTIIVAVQAIPPITLLIPYLSLIVTIKLYNTYWALILTYLIFTLPYAILMTTGYFNTLPKELDEAVMIDGGSRFKALWKILVPTSVPGLVSVGMYTFMQAWNEYLFALALTKTNNMRTVPVGINLLMGQHAYEWSQMMAMSVLGSLPILVLFLFFQRYFIAGMTAGSVKN
ncbi:extracellular solute-binding protein [[Clostridium] scindens]